MPAPVAKGIIISVAALVAAGIAVYQSPQFRQWVEDSRRKVAVALHHLGDEIQPRSASPSSSRQDISMTEDMGAAAEERRRLAREELQRRRSFLEENRKRRQNASPGSFDALVDDEGNLLHTDIPELGVGSLANSTAVELSTSQAIQRGGKQANTSTSPTNENEGSRAVPETDGLRVSIPPTDSRSSTLVNYTPTSDDASERGFSASSSTLGHADISDRTGESSQLLFEYPGEPRNETSRDLRSPFSELSELGPTGFEQDRPSTPSTAGSFSQIYESAVDGSSDGTLSDLGESLGVATPSSWSEVGSVISNDDGHPQAMQ
ncbi:hypothetical protein FE257_005110 [Aspergillus nanangensis]|uniref:Uncharacterized protein n=1 Tax=Aspergillus nanangensis TaxID=2582783 RepID=A0AAD4GMZ3_ASPNN|nr:hypothetical protein FE257_005110 [Aspergillus nanangensis]